jgi:hypothetical protein
MVAVDRERRVPELSTSDASYHRMLVVVPSPTRTWPHHRPWSTSQRPMQHGRIPTRTFDRSWLVSRSSEAQSVWSGPASQG